MAHPDFRVGGVRGRIFATLTAEGDAGVVKLTPEQQERCAGQLPGFSALAGAWGERGYTRIELRVARVRDVSAALRLAWENVGGGRKR